MPTPHFPLPIIKICGVMRIADARLSLRLGADYLGVIVDISRSPRSLSVMHARPLLQAAAGRGVVVTEHPDPGYLLCLSDYCRPKSIQLHGGQGPEFVARATRLLRERQRPGDDPEVWGVVSLPADSGEAREALPSLCSLARDFAAAGATKLVLDSRVAGQSGGTGVPVNWHLAAEVVAECPVPVLIAGGITPDNALEALQTTGAAGVDVSSGVETSPGVKCPHKLRSLLEGLRSPQQ